MDREGGIMARRAAYRRKRQNGFGMLLVMTVIIMMLVVVMVKSIELKQKLAEEVAKDKLGLVHEGEIIFKDED